MGVTIIDNTQVINNATWKVQPDVLTTETGIVKENGTIHYIGGKLKYHADGAVLPLSGVTEYATQVLDYVQSPTTATTGNRYLMNVAADSPYTIAEYNGTTWVYTPLATGQLIEVLSTGKTYRYDSNLPLSPLTEYGSQKALASQLVEYNETVLDYVSSPTTATTGNKYLMNVASENPYTIGEYNGTSWVYTPLVNNQLIEVLATGKTYRYDSNIPLSPLTEYGSQKALATNVPTKTQVSYDVLDYVDSVGTATTGNKYLMSVAAENPYTIGEYNGTAWVYTALFNGQVIEVLATGRTYRYNGTTLVEYGEQRALAKLTLSRKTDSYTLVYADQLKTIEMNKATANTLTVPANVFVAGNQILITQYGAGQTTIAAGAGMTLRSDGGKLKINTQYSSATILFISATEAYVFGNLAL